MKKPKQNNDTEPIMRMLEKMYVQRVRDLREIEQALKDIRKINKKRENEQDREQTEQEMVQSDDRYTGNLPFPIPRSG
ncbi:hypothetical protein [Acidithiobacillus marinus]|uniref:hypothetical protein n=1 Tax=Acidithiobacillus marinus TaxID=187490 RepID=UPI00117AC2B9|nr:hypothetical protein [Acidithiobacillus marinus]